jgi:N-methylhydantoinase A
MFIGTDIGGTFTDLVGYDEATGSLFFGKSLTQHQDLVGGVVKCLHDVDVPVSRIDILKHGTTLIINTLLERRGGRTALVTTRGFADILEIGRAGRPFPFDLEYARQPPLVPRPLRLEIDERISASGEIVRTWNDDDIEALISRLGNLNVDAVAIAFINSYRNPEHERKLAEILRSRLPDVYVTCSTELSREWFEYERTSTAVANAYVGPRTSGYLDHFDRRLAAENFSGKFFLMGSNGGVLSVDHARAQPIALVESGPIGGCIGAAAYAKALGIDRLIAFDMGGTTAKCALLEQYHFDVHASYYVGGYEYGFPVQSPVLDIVEVGTGGGSIAYVDDHGRMRVGPRSAGSEPGPVCFGRGGRDPTVTDANLVLGRIGSGPFLSGSLALDDSAAAQALSESVGSRLGYPPGSSIDAVASGILALANAQMATAIKEITIERGKDVRDFDLFAFGGGGPLHAVSLARELNIKRVVVPPEPGNFSALGMLLADARLDEAHNFIVEVKDGIEAFLSEEMTRLQSSVRSQLNRDFDTGAIRFECQSDMRYRGQRHTIRIRLTGAESANDIRSRFFATYQKVYGLAASDGTVEITGLRVAGFVPSKQPDLARLHRAGTMTNAAPGKSRSLYMLEANARAVAPVLHRQSLAIGTGISGPAVVEEFGSTTVIGPGDRLEVGRLGELVITLG